MVSASRSARLVLVTLALGGCRPAEAPTQGSDKAVRTAPPPKDDPMASSGATWRYLPGRPRVVHQDVSLGDTTRLLLTDRGDRWLVKGASSDVTPGAPETLVHAFPEGKVWRFVGVSGAVYHADQPLEPLELTVPSPGSLVKVAPLRDEVIAIDRQRRLRRAVGQKFVETGPADVEFVDVAAVASGELLALAVPEQLWRSADFGVTWQRVAGDDFAARHFSPRPGAVDIRSDFGQRRWSGGLTAPLRVRRGGRRFTRSRPSTRRAVSAAAVHRGSASIAGSRYFEVERAGAGWRLVEGTPFGELRTRPLDVAWKCSAVQVAAHRRSVVVACAMPQKTPSCSPTLRFYRSDDAGRHFRLEPFSARGRLAAMGGGNARVRAIAPRAWSSMFGRKRSRPSTLRCAGVPTVSMAVGEQGGLAVAGACAGERGACRRDAMLIQTKFEQLGDVLVPAHYPKGVRALPAARFEGARMATLGCDKERDRLTLLERGDGSRLRRVEFASGSASLGCKHLRPDTRFSLSEADGVVSIVVHTEKPRWITVRDGRASTAQLPEPFVRMATMGAHALALSPKTRRVWESLDGATFRSVGFLRANACFGAGCEERITCDRLGCAIGDSIERAGWGADAATPVIAQTAQSTTVVTAPAPRAPTTHALTCRTVPGADWTTVPKAFGFPSVDAVGNENVAWAVATYDGKTGETGMVSADRAGSVSARQLLAPTEARSREALLWHHGGMVAVRDLIVGSELSEVAWFDTRAKKLGTRRMKLKGPVTKLDGGPKHRRIGYSMLRVAGGAAFVRRRPRGETLMLTATGAKWLPPVPWPSATRRGKGTWMRGGQTPLPAILGPSGRLAYGVLRDGAWQVRGVTLGLPTPKIFGVTQRLDWSHQGGKPGIAVSEQGQTGASWFYPFTPAGDIGPRRPAASLSDLSTIRPCTAADRRASAAMELRPTTWTGRFEEGGGLAMRVDSIVAYGRGDDACVDSVTASLKRARPRARVIVDLATKRAWRFRRDGRSLLRQPVTCGLK